MRFKFQKTKHGCVGAIEIPTLHSPGKIIAASVGEDRADALAKAALVAERIAKDPVLRAIMPPQAAAAISAAKGLAAAAKQGPHALRSIWHRLHGEGKKRLAEVLHAEASELEKPAEQVGWNPFRKKKTRRPARQPRGDNGRGDSDDGDDGDDSPDASEPQPTSRGRRHRGHRHEREDHDDDHDDDHDEDHDEGHDVEPAQEPAAPDNGGAQ